MPMWFCTFIQASPVCGEEKEKDVCIYIRRELTVDFFSRKELCDISAHACGPVPAIFLFFLGQQTGMIYVDCVFLDRLRSFFYSHVWLCSFTYICVLSLMEKMNRQVMTVGRDRREQTLLLLTPAMPV